MTVMHQQLSQLSSAAEFISAVIDLSKNPKILDKVKKEMDDMTARFDKDIEAGRKAREDIARAAEAIADAEAAKRNAEEAEKKAAEQRAALAADKKDLEYVAALAAEAKSVMSGIDAEKERLKQLSIETEKAAELLKEQKAKFEAEVAAFEEQKQQLRSLVG